MFGASVSAPGRWLVVEVASEHMLRFGIASPSAHPRIERSWQIDVRGLPTFTDALQKFERESGIAVRGLDCAMAFAGAVSGEQLALARSRWTITRSGITAVFGKDVQIINTIAARAWAVKSGAADVQAIRGAGAPDLARAGRYVLMLVDEGVGAAVIDVDRDGAVRILETEAGHADYPAASEQEQLIASAVKGMRAHASWEQMLKADPQGPEFEQACPGLPQAERQRVLARILGRFCVNLMHMYGAWQGVIITGGRSGKILDASNRSAFEAAFSERGRFSRLVLGCPIWRVDQRDAVLQGAAECLAEHSRMPTQQAA